MAPCLLYHWWQRMRHRSVNGRGTFGGRTCAGCEQEVTTQNSYQYMRVIKPCLSEGINALAQFPKMLNIPSRHALCFVCFKNPSVSSQTWLTRLKCTMRVQKMKEKTTHHSSSAENRYSMSWNKIDQPKMERRDICIYVDDATHLQWGQLVIVCDNIRNEN